MKSSTSNDMKYNFTLFWIFVSVNYRSVYFNFSFQGLVKKIDFLLKQKSIRKINEANGHSENDATCEKIWSVSLENVFSFFCFL